ncbi:acetamidase/formamidase family protein [Leptolyngbya sp. FACHB-261]|uniref:acetamidase/formamidase family protein n=1 Tax=Leptolyngbya sp. FACHB-261 TaxID=2692806 RepID=UPI001684FB95|nr:acetamidase/formamidase family protein [Leptolyngbya sp. FACHB-261]MBD2102611.1 acetamidase/formamidase family protein [Leptolyngbya sp. FACHB-261]
MQKTNHTIHAGHHHYGWDRSLPPILTVAPGETVELDIQDASSGQLTPDSTVADVLAFDFSRTNPVTGPIYIEGAEPGDAVKLTVQHFQPSGWGWTAIIPGFGLLADQFPEAALHIWRYDSQALTPAAYGPGGRVPLKPFAGTIGLALAEPGLHSVVPPRRVGGNLDIRDLAVGSILYLPVEVAGGLLSIGDTHAAQGDGEVCGTAIESPMGAAFTIDLVKGANLKFPHFETSTPVTNHLDRKGYYVTTGISPDLMIGAREAVSGMIDWLGKAHQMDAAEAYMLCSVCADLRISEVVDMPNWVVSCYFPKVVFE